MTDVEQSGTPGTPEQARGFSSGRTRKRFQTGSAAAAAPQQEAS